MHNSLSFRCRVIDSGFLLAWYECEGKSRLFLKINVWDLKTITDSSTSSRIIEPLIDVAVFPRPLFVADLVRVYM